jgi:hypothetical protein
MLNGFDNPGHIEHLVYIYIYIYVPVYLRYSSTRFLAFFFLNIPLMEPGNFLSFFRNWVQIYRDLREKQEPVVSEMTPILLLQQSGTALKQYQHCLRQRRCPTAVLQTIPEKDKSNFSDIAETNRIKLIQTIIFKAYCHF